MIPQEWSDQEKAFLQDKDEGKNGKTVPTSPSGQGTFASTVFLLFNSAVGQGILTLPYCFLVAGIVPTTITIFFFAVVTGFSSIAIVISQEAEDAYDYQTIVKQRLGRTASYLMSANLAAYCLLNCVGALIIVADNILPVLIHFFGKQEVWWMQRETTILVGGMISFPLMCFRDITSLWFTASLALAATLFIVCVVVYQALSHPSSGEEYGQIEVFVPSLSMCQALPLVCLAYQNQMQVPQIYGELQPKIKSVRTMTWAVIASYFIITPMYMAIAFGGYFMFRDRTPADILEGPYAQSATSIFIARLFVALVAILRVPVNHHTARSSLYTLWESFSRKQPLASGQASEIPTEPSESFRWVEVVTYSVLMVVLALHIRSLAVALDIMSAACAMAVMFFMPGLFFLKGKRYSLGWRVLARAFIVIGAVLAVVSIGDVFKEAAK